MSYSEVRCRSNRIHYIKGIEHQKCGALLLGVNMLFECNIIVKCKVCKKYFNIISRDNILYIEELEETRFGE